MSLQVAHFVPRYPPALGGAEAYAQRLTHFLEARGDSVTVWTTNAIALEELWSVKAAKIEDSACSKVRRYQPVGFPLRRYILKALSLIPQHTIQALAQPVNPICPAMWRDVHRERGPLDAVHALAFPYSFPLVCALRLAQRRRVPFFLTPFLHLGDPTDPHDRTRKQYTRPHLKWLLKQADGVFVQTPSEAQAVQQIGVSASRIVLQGLGVDAGECTGGHRDRARCRWGVTGDTAVVGHLSNNSVEKGTVDLLKAAAQTGVRVVLAGPEMPNFRRFWETFSRKELVTRLGPLSDEQKRDFFAGIDVFALPSRTDSFGLVLLEAWANGKPALAYRAGGPADLIRHGIDGFLARCGDLDELGRQLRELATRSELRAKMGTAGRERVASEFRWEDKLQLVQDTIRERVKQRLRSG